MTKRAEMAPSGSIYAKRTKKTEIPAPTSPPQKWVFFREIFGPVCFVVPRVLGPDNRNFEGFPQI